MNITDRKFFGLINEIKKLSQAEILNVILKAYGSVPEQTRKNCEEFFNKYGFWGRLSPANGIYEEMELKARALHEHTDDFVWLYGRLADCRSKSILYAVLSNWYRYDFKSAAASKEYLYDEYFDHDLLHCSPDEVVVNLGAYVGDTVLAYMVNFGKDCYKKIYCYEITPDVFRLMERNLAEFPNIDMRMKGVGDKTGFSTISECGASASANSISDECGATGDIEVTTLDDDITEPITLVIADIEGSERRALAGAAQHILRDRPKLLISVYHGNDDLWNIPRQIDGIRDDYSFYLRYKGSVVYPTEITLFAL